MWRLCIKFFFSVGGVGRFIAFHRQIKWILSFHVYHNPINVCVERSSNKNAFLCKFEFPLFVTRRCNNEQTFARLIEKRSDFVSKLQFHISSPVSVIDTHALHQFILRLFTRKRSTWSILLKGINKSIKYINR